MSTGRTLALFLAITALCTQPASGQSVVVTRNVNLRTGPSTSFEIIDLLQPSDELILLEPERTSNYYHVQTVGGDVGWVWGNNVRVLEPLVTTAQNERFRQLNRLKNRNRAPTAGDMDTTATLAQLLEPGDDRERWSEDQGAEIVGFVFEVKPGGQETVNCGAKTLPLRDTHIELTLTSSDTLKTQRVVVEVTPRWRGFMEEQGLDWSTGALREDLKGECARFTGWFFWDDPHWNEAENTDPGGEHNWRATAWEIHPITGIESVACPGE